MSELQRHRCYFAEVPELPLSDQSPWPLVAEAPQVTPQAIEGQLPLVPAHHPLDHLSQLAGPHQFGL